jgi:hypothetical protein
VENRGWKGNFEVVGGICTRTWKQELEAGSGSKKRKQKRRRKEKGEVRGGGGKIKLEEEKEVNWKRKLDSGKLSEAERLSLVCINLIFLINQQLMCRVEITITRKEFFKTWHFGTFS